MGSITTTKPTVKTLPRFLKKDLFKDIKRLQTIQYRNHNTFCKF